MTDQAKTLGDDFSIRYSVLNYEQSYETTIGELEYYVGEVLMHDRTISHSTAAEVLRTKGNTVNLIAIYNKILTKILVLSSGLGSAEDLAETNFTELKSYKKLISHRLALLDSLHYTLDMALGEYNEDDRH